jgi:large subunit ribosomal protein L25
LPSALPEFLEVDLAGLDIGETIHLSNVVLPAGIEIVVLAQGPEHDLPVASMMASKASKDEAAE